MEAVLAMCSESPDCVESLGSLESSDGQKPCKFGAFPSWLASWRCPKLHYGSRGCRFESCRARKYSREVKPARPPIAAHAVLEHVVSCVAGSSLRNAARPQVAIGTSYYR